MLAFHHNQLPAVAVSFLDFEPLVFEKGFRTSSSGDESGDGRQHFSTWNGTLSDASRTPADTNARISSRYKDEISRSSRVSLGSLRGKSCVFAAEAPALAQALQQRDSMSLMVISKISERQVRRSDMDGDLVNVFLCERRDGLSLSG